MSARFYRPFASVVGILIATAICIATFVLQPKPSCSDGGDPTAADNNLISFDVRHPVWASIRDTFTFNKAGDSCFGKASAVAYLGWSDAAFQTLRAKSHSIYVTTRHLLAGCLILAILGAVIRIMIAIVTRRNGRCRHAATWDFQVPP